jgi:hypothetical protein
MGRVFRKKLFLYMALAYTSLCVMGHFALTTLEPLRVINFEVKDPAANKISSSIEEYSFPNQDGIAVIRRPGNPVFSPQNMGLQRTVSVPGPATIGTAYTRAPFMQGAKTQYTYLESTRTLKLRI